MSEKERTAEKWLKDHPRKPWTDAHRNEIGKLMLDLADALGANPILIWGDTIFTRNDALPDDVKKPLERLLTICVSETGPVLYERGDFD